MNQRLLVAAFKPVVVAAGLSSVAGAGKLSAVLKRQEVLAGRVGEIKPTSRFLIRGVQLRHLSTNSANTKAMWIRAFQPTNKVLKQVGAAVEIVLGPNIMNVGRLIEAAKEKMQLTDPPQLLHLFPSDVIAAKWVEDNKNPQAQPLKRSLTAFPFSAEDRPMILLTPAMLTVWLHPHQRSRVGIKQICPPTEITVPEDADVDRFIEAAKAKLHPNLQEHSIVDLRLFSSLDVAKQWAYPPPPKAGIMATEVEAELQKLGFQPSALLAKSVRPDHSQEQPFVLLPTTEPVFEPEQFDLQAFLASEIFQNVKDEITQSLEQLSSAHGTHFWAVKQARSQSDIKDIALKYYQDSFGLKNVLASPMPLNLDTKQAFDVEAMLHSALVDIADSDTSTAQAAPILRSESAVAGSESPQTTSLGAFAANPDAFLEGKQLVAMVQGTGTGKSRSLLDLHRRSSLNVCYIELSHLAFADFVWRLLAAGYRGLDQKLSRADAIRKTTKNAVGSLVVSGGLVALAFREAHRAKYPALRDTSQHKVDFGRFMGNDGKLVCDLLFETLISTYEPCSVVAAGPEVFQLVDPGGRPVAAIDEAGEFTRIIPQMHFLGSENAPEQSALHAVFKGAHEAIGDAGAVIFAGTTLSLGPFLQPSSIVKPHLFGGVISGYSLSGADVKKMLQTYFPSLEVSEAVAARWTGRVRLVSEYLLLPLFRRLAPLRVATVAPQPDLASAPVSRAKLQSLFDEVERSQYPLAVDYLCGYICGLWDDTRRWPLRSPSTTSRSGSDGMREVSPRQLLVGLLFQMRFSSDTVTQLPLHIAPGLFAVLVERGVIARFCRAGRDESGIYYYETQRNEPALVDALFDVAGRAPLDDVLTEEILASNNLTSRFEQGLALQIPARWDEISSALQELGATELQNYEIDKNVNIMFAPKGDESLNLKPAGRLVEHLHQAAPGSASATAPSGGLSQAPHTETAGSDLIVPLKPRRGVMARPALLWIQAKFWDVTDAEQIILNKTAKQGLIDAMQTVRLLCKQHVLRQHAERTQGSGSKMQAAGQALGTPVEGLQTRAGTSPSKTAHCDSSLDSNEYCSFGVVLVVGCTDAVWQAVLQETWQQLPRVRLMTLSDLCSARRCERDTELLLQLLDVGAPEGEKRR